MLKRIKKEHKHTLGSVKHFPPHTQNPSVVLQIIDVLFSFCYDWRINQFQPSSESAWGICALSSTLSWFCDYREKEL